MEYSLSIKKCAGCNKPIPFDRKRQRFCSHSCAAMRNNLGVARNGKRHPWAGKKRPCAVCGAVNPNHESHTCSRKCGADLKYFRFIEQWKAGKEPGMKGSSSTSAHIDRYFREKYGNACQYCRWGTVNPHTGRVPLQLHHEDGQYRNNAEENLRLLCPNCHALTENYGFRNKGSGRADRRFRRSSSRGSSAGSVNQ